MVPEPHTITGGVFRANPAYELVVYERMTEPERAAVGQAKDDPSFYGVLRPRDGRLSAKAVDRDTALLFFSLGEPGALPRFATLALGAECNSAIAGLVLDGVLQLRTGEGEFVCGAQAHFHLYSVRDEAAEPRGRIAALSRSALDYGRLLQGLNASQLSRRLYLYHALPLSPAWRRRLPDAAAVLRHWGIHEGAVRDTLSRYWSKVEPDTAAGWIAWRAKAGGARAGDLMHKLYISPDPEHAGAMLRLAVAVLTDAEALYFKIGGDLAGLLRPDKAVAYFRSRQSMLAAAGQLGVRGSDLPPHGAPFTAELSGAGLLSWGIDPPLPERGLPWEARQSWRIWLTNRLATALIAAAADGADSPVEFALDRLRLDGIDTNTWAPFGGGWPNETN